MTLRKNTLLTRERIQTFALLAAGWARAGKVRVASDMLLSLANKDFDSSKIDLNAITFDWAKKKWRWVCTRSHTYSLTHSNTHTHTFKERERERDVHKCTHACMHVGTLAHTTTAAATARHGISSKVACTLICRFQSRTLRMQRVQVKGFDFTLPTVVKQQLPPTREAEVSCMCHACLHTALLAFQPATFCCSSP